WFQSFVLDNLCWYSDRCRMRCFYELNGHGRNAYALHPQTLAASTRDFVVGVITLPEDVAVAMPGDNVTIKVDLIKPVALEVGTSFAFREGGKTIGSGKIIEILPN
ncbi:MAG: hypothetical protein Q8869_02835, partial [Candidatus Phytoplasma australasiaticum]|nr:hypothetical protein [Candidatus Phytoplasma australasiaticum]